jgi:hypothetical protein
MLRNLWCMSTTAQLRSENELLKRELATRDEQLATRDEQLASREQELAAQFHARMEEVNAQHAKDLEAVQLEL